MINYFLILSIMCSLTCHAKILLTYDESKKLESFFRFIFEQSEVGYVLEGVKPVCILEASRNFEEYAGFPLHKKSFILLEGIKIWNNKIEPHLNLSEFIIKSLEINGLIHSHRQHFFLFINKKMLIKTIKKNLLVFRYILGPHLTPEELLKELIKPQGFQKLVQDNVLVGIILGYGAENSLFVSRIEFIDSYLQSGELFPLLNKGLSKTPEYHYLLYFKESDKPWIHNPCPPSLGFSTLDEEYQQLKSQVNLPWGQLTELTPRFIYGFRKKDPFATHLNHLLIHAQEKIQKKLKKTHFLQDVLTVFLPEEEVAIIQPTKTVSVQNTNDDDLIAKKLVKSFSMNGYNHDEILSIIEGFEDPEKTENFKALFTGFPGCIKRIEKAVANLESANVFFKTLKYRHDLKEIERDYLYIKTIEEGTEERSKNSSSILFDCTVYHPNGDIIFEKKNCLTDLTQAISGFVKGTSDMKIGETRLIFIHPALGYGLHTFSEKCLYFTVKVKLKDVRESHKEELPSTKIKDLTFILDPSWMENEKNKHKLALKSKGKHLFYFFQKASFLNPREITKRLKFYVAQKKIQILLDEYEEERVNEIFWKIYNSTL